MSVKETLKQLESEKTKVLMAELYGAEKAEENRARYRYVAEHFEKTYGERDIKLFTSPGRTEISGNHTESQSWQGAGGQHQPDCVGAAAPNGTDTIRILSETFHQKFQHPFK
ncbi:MAG: galactokinase family protein [Clostridium fessum]